MKQMLYFNLLLTLTLNACNLDKESPIQQSGETKKVNEVLSVSNINIDIKSPDNAVKSMWAVLDEKRKSFDRMCEDSLVSENKLNEKVLQNLKKVSNGLMLESYSNKVKDCFTYKYSKEIIEVKNESETRAIVFAKFKNITPIPIGAIPDEIDIEQRPKGRDYKYVLEKDSQGWKVIQAFIFNEYATEGDVWNAVYDGKDNSSIKLSYPSLILIDGTI